MEENRDGQKSLPSRELLQEPVQNIFMSNNGQAYCPHNLTELLILKKASRRWYMMQCKDKQVSGLIHFSLLLDYFLFIVQISGEPTLGKTLATSSTANKSKSNLSMTLSHRFYVIDRIYPLDVVQCSQL